MNPIEALLVKSGEFYTCAHHLHMRGMGEIIEECRPIVAELIADGKSFFDVIDFIEEISQQKIEVARDPFLAKVKDLFETKFFCSWDLVRNQRTGHLEVVPPGQIVDSESKRIPVVERAAFERATTENRRLSISIKSTAITFEAMKADWMKLQELLEKADKMISMYSKDDWEQAKKEAGWAPKVSPDKQDKSR